jgi:hypothetical protein
MSVTEANDRVAATAASSVSKTTSDLLARAFLDILSRAAGAESKPLLRSGDPDDPIEQLLDDLSGSADPDNQTSIRPDIAAVAILTARHRGGTRADQGAAARQSRRHDRHP